MTQEIEWQAKLVRRFKMERGYARKASSSWAVGVLDLDVITQVTGNVKIEVKMEKGLKPGWKRTPDYTEKQKEEAANIIEAGGHALGLVVCHYSPTNVWLYMHEMPPPRGTVKITEEVVMSQGVRWVKSGGGLYLTQMLVDALNRTKQ